MLAATVLPLFLIVGWGGTNLSHRRTEGEVRVYLHRVEERGMDLEEAPVTFLQELTTTETCVEALPRGEVTSDVRLDRLLVELVKKGVRAAYDSAVPGGSPPEAREFPAHLLPIYRAMTGATVVVKQGPSGRIEGIEGAERIAERMTADLPAGDPLREGAGFRVMRALHYLLSPNLLVPVTPVAADSVQKFRDHRPLPNLARSPGLMYFVGETRLVEVKDGIARLELTAEVTLDPPPGMQPWPAPMARFREQVRLQRGVCRGFARIDVEKGILLEDEHRTDLDLFQVKPDGSGETPLPVVIIQSTRLQ